MLPGLLMRPVLTSARYGLDKLPNLAGLDDDMLMTPLLFRQRNRGVALCQLVTPRPRFSSPSGDAAPVPAALVVSSRLVQFREKVRVMFRTSLMTTLFEL